MIPELLGGIGLFLLGMTLLSDGLKAAAGDALRGLLRGMVSRRLSAFASGAAITVLVQSSSATTLMTIGFVSAGIIAFPEAVGVIFGASLGTTSTGWIVSLLGLEVSIVRLALPLVGAGALMRLLGRDRTAAIGLALAGFGLIFVGIDVLQGGMESLAQRFDPRDLPGDGLPGRLLLVAVGVALTVVIQSSSAAVATTLTALHSGALTLPQAAALVIGASVGTTVTSALATVGASTAARRTALAHILFNASTGVLAFLLLSPFLSVARLIASPLGGGAAVALAAFHSTFTLVGVLIFVPWARGFARLIERLVPERGPLLTVRLDPTVAGIPSVAVEAARLTLRDVAGELVGWMRAALASDARSRPTEQLGAAREALGEVRRFLASVRTDPETAAARERHLDTLHALDHVERLADACAEGAPAPGPHQEQRRAAAQRVLIALDDARPWLLGEGADESPAEALGEVSRRIAASRREQRRLLLERTAAGHTQPDEGLAELEAMRWVDRLAYHLWRAVHHLSEGAADDAHPEGLVEPPEPRPISGRKARSPEDDLARRPGG